MDFKDYYEILGVSPSASKKDIQQTYRKLARKYHPDVNPGNKEMEEKFKAINEAYQVLSNDEQRKKFDQVRTQYLQWQQSGGRQQDFDWQRWANPQAGGASQPGGVHVEYANVEDFEDLFGEESPYSDFFTNLFGQGRRGGKGARRTASTGPRPGRDVEYDINLTLEEAYRGAERLLEVDGRRATVRIPPGVNTGSRVRFAGQGEPGHNGAQAGDLYLLVHILPNQTYERAGDDLHMDVPVDIFTAIAGGEVRVPALEKQLILTIPPRTNANQSFRLRGKGMPHLGSPDKHGDLYARVRLVLPEGLTDQEIESIRALASARKKSPEKK